MVESELVNLGAVAVIYDRRAYADFTPDWFDTARWKELGAHSHSATGRGSVLMLDRDNETWVYRHYHRGGLVAHLVRDQYLWRGLDRSRPFREWRLLAAMHAQSLPVQLCTGLTSAHTEHWRSEGRTADQSKDAATAQRSSQQESSTKTIAYFCKCMTV